MRTATEEEKKMAIALAIYRGLPDNERAQKLSELRTLPGYNARTLVVLCEQHEMSVRLEKERLSALEREVKFVRAQLAQTAGQTYGQQPDIYGQQAAADIRRGAFGVGLVAAGIAGAYYLFTVIGPGMVFGGVAVAILFRAMFSGGGEKQGDYAQATGQAGHTVTVNVNVGNGTGTATTQAG